MIDPRGIRTDRDFNAARIRYHRHSRAGRRGRRDWPSTLMGLNASDESALLEAVYHSADVGICVTDEQRRFVKVNQAYCETYGYTADELIGKPFTVVLPADRRAAAERIHDAFLRGGNESAGQWQVVRKDGALREVWVTAARVVLPNGRRYKATTVTDITEQARDKQRLEHLALYDPLTGLPNRLRLNEALGHAMNRHHGTDKQLAVAYIDLDDFKSVNDTHGFARSDRILAGIARRIATALRDDDMLARVGGDEFVVVIEGVRDVEEARRRIASAHRAPLRSAARRPRTNVPSASIGLALYPQAAALEAEQLIRQADHAMYAAKQAGKNRIAIFDPDHDSAVRDQNETIDAVRQALGRREFTLHYQPKVHLPDGRVIGAEALIRWQHPDHGLLPPGDFLPALEATPVSVEVGDWVLETAARQVVAWREQGYALPVSINVDGYQIAQPDFIDKLERCLARHPTLQPGDLELEVLESSALDDIARVRSVIDACRRLGIGFSLDDFGTGYATLNYLKNLPAPQLKIDRTFVGDMLDDPDDLAILDGVQSLARKLARQTIAEGVETLDHGTMLLALGCERAQGFGIAPPMPASALVDWLTQWTPPAQWRSMAPVTPADMPAVFALVAYSQWLGQVEHALYQNQSVPPAWGAEQALQQWLDANIKPVSEASLTPVDRERRSALIRIRDLHRSIHNEALRCLNATHQPSPERWQSLMQQRDELLRALLSALTHTPRDPDRQQPLGPGPRFPVS